MTALKPVRLEQVRQPERSQVPGRWCVSLPNWETGPVISKKPALAEQKWPESRHQQPKASSHLYFFCFYSFLALSFKSFFFHFLADAAQYESLYHRTAHHARLWLGTMSTSKSWGVNRHNKWYISPVSMVSQCKAGVWLRATETEISAAPSGSSRTLPVLFFNYNIMYHDAATARYYSFDFYFTFPQLLQLRLGLQIWTVGGHTPFLSLDPKCHSTAGHDIIIIIIIM